LGTGGYVEEREEEARVETRPFPGNARHVRVGKGSIGLSSLLGSLSPPHSGSKGLSPVFFQPPP